MKSADYTNILIIKPSALGDIVHALPVLPSLRQAFPQARLTWLVRKELAPLLECAEGLNEVLLFDRKGMAKWFCHPKAFGQLCEFREQLRSPQFDLVLDLQGLLRSGIFSKMTNSKTRIGMEEAREFACLFYTHCVNRPTDSVHILDYYFEVLRDIGVATCVPTCSLTAPATAQNSVQKKLVANELSPKKFIALIPGSAHAYKCWPTEKFARLAELFYQMHGWKAVVVGTASENVYAKKIQSLSTSPVIDLTGQTSIPELVTLFDRAGVVVSNDTGPGHIALNTNTPGVIIFGNTNPLRLGPYRRPECIAAVDLESRGVEIKDTDPAHQIENVTVEMVLEKIEAQLEK